VSQIAPIVAPSIPPSSAMIARPWRPSPITPTDDRRRELHPREARVSVGSERHRGERPRGLNKNLCHRRSMSVT
jgi:hypothetical protein